jgi:hypothetical protein
MWEGFRRNRRKIRMIGKTMDSDWDENGSEVSEEEVENGEELEEEMIRLRRTRRRLRRVGLWREWMRRDEEYSVESNESEDLGEGSEAEPGFRGGEEEGETEEKEEDEEE